MKRAALLLFAVGLAAASSTVGRAAPATDLDAAGDVRLLARALEETHPDLFRHVSRRQFRAHVDGLARRARELRENELLTELMRVAALPGPRNGHTGIFPLAGHRRQLHLFPLRLYDFADGLHVVDERTEDDLLGARVVAIAGVPAARVLELVRPLVPRDNASGLRGYTPHYALVAEILDGLGIADGVGPTAFRVMKRTGEIVDLTLAPIPAGEYAAAFADPLHGHYPAALPSRRKPLFLAHAGRELWMTKLARGRAIYVGYNSAQPPTERAASQLARLVRNPAVRRVIVDVRLNGGGSNTTYVPLLQTLASQTVNRRGRLYLLFGRATFSAAGNFATDVESVTRAISVGEPTGGGVNQYGDATGFTLPATGVELFVATQYVMRALEADRRLTVEPDVPVAMTSADFLAERDPVLARALRGL